MNWFGYRNISKIIMTTTILIILSNTLLISLFYYNNQFAQYQENLQNLKNENIYQQQMSLKNDINILIKMIEFKYTKTQLNEPKIQKEIIRWISHISFDQNKSDYIFVYELLDKRGGDKFARMIINPNRKDLVGKYISTNYKDIHGFRFRDKFLKDINLHNDSIVTYSYKKTNQKIETKSSYFRYYKPLNWILAKGIYHDDIKQDMLAKNIVLKQKFTNHITENILVFGLFFLVAIIITFLIGKKVKDIIYDKQLQVKKTTKALALLNRELDSKVKIEIEKNKEQELLLMQKSKFVTLGETISLIAHQWRQPLSELGAIILNIKLHHKLNKLDNKMMSEKTKESEILLEYMSKTIDDFRTFFKPNKIKNDFNIYSSCQRVLQITKPMLDGYSISIIQNIDKTITINSYQNEFEQVILNLISNAKDALLSDKIKSPEIIINIYKEDKIYIKISDNANGIEEAIAKKIFEPYFTTKTDTDGTGLGLYMSKIIIEKNMNGNIELQSNNKGSCFKITLSIH
jgi:signal transduction histidine kinase